MNCLEFSFTYALAGDKATAGGKAVERAGARHLGELADRDHAVVATELAKLVAYDEDRFHANTPIHVGR